MSNAVLTRSRDVSDVPMGLSLAATSSDERPYIDCKKISAYR